ncbi:MAG: type II secretion system protein GspM [Pseudomonadota bacterium]
MQLVPDAQNGRLTAVLLLVIVLIAVYFLGFHWFFQRHAAFAEEIGGLREQLVRFEAQAAQREPLQAQLASIREGRSDEGLFLAEQNFNEAAAFLSERLGRMVQNQDGDDCQIVSRQPIRPRVQERFQRVTVNVRMRCRAGDMLDILYQLESQAPMVLVDDLNVLKPRARRRGRNNNRNNAQANQALDVRFNMSGYLR